MTTNTGNSSKFILILDVLSRLYTLCNMHWKLQSYRISWLRLLDRCTCTHMVSTCAINPLPSGHIRFTAQLHRNRTDHTQQGWCFFKAFDLQHVYRAAIQSTVLWSFIPSKAPKSKSIIHLFVHPSPQFRESTGHQLYLSFLLDACRIIHNS